MTEADMQMQGDCPFCTPHKDRQFLSSGSVIGIWDAFPVSPGHALLVPRRHVATWFEASAGEREALMTAVQLAKEEIENHHKPDGYNIGINSGVAAGQTVPHLHVHLIPRYHGDSPDPRGGIRLAFPDKAAYWKK